MKKIILSLILFAFSAISAFAQGEAKLDIHPTKKIEANPINIAVMLMQENDTAAIASTLRYYGYTPSSTLKPDTSTPDTWLHPNGSSIRYSLSDPNLSDYTIEVTSRGSSKDKENLLQSLNFKKTGNSYEQKFVGFTVRGTFAPRGTLILKRLPKAP